MTSKSKLQEIYQKQGLPLPQYILTRIGGSDHAPLFRSTVILPCGKKYTSEGSSRKDAEKKVAEKAIIEIRGKTRVRSRTKERVCILVDLENRPKIPEQLSEYLQFPNIDLIAFASTEHHTIQNLRNLSLKGVKIIEVPCTRKDGADVGLTLFMGVLLYQNSKVNGSYNHFIIVSGDNFGYCLKDCVEGIDKMIPNIYPPNVSCCRTLKGVLDLLV